MNKLRILFAAFLITCLTGCTTTPQKKTDTLYQVSTIGALMQGNYDGDVTLGQLKQHGDFGIGTFNELDGEMVLLDGTCYQVRNDGAVYPASDYVESPFAMVKFFTADRVEKTNQKLDYGGMTRLLNSLIVSKNIYCAIRIDGVFEYMKTRSVPRQTKPYAPLVEVVKKQTVFEFKNVKGTIVGFYSPEFAKGIDPAGYHLHFITDDRRAGGHVIEFTTGDVVVSLDQTNEFYMKLPGDDDFYTADLSVKEKDVEKAEKQ